MSTISTSRVILFGTSVVLIAVVLRFVVFREPSKAPDIGREEVLEADPLPPDPRLAFETVFRNVKPDVHYVGDAACSNCHGDICKSYHSHPMGRSAAYVNNAVPFEKFDAQSNNPCKIGQYQLRVERTQEGALHHVSSNDSEGKPLEEFVMKANLAIGSGTRGRSYLSVENGSVWQSPISWFSKDSKWDISPGFDLGNGGRRVIVAECLFCHVNQVEPIEHAINRYREPLLRIQATVGCERCHGPGQLHVTERTSGNLTTKIDTSIVNPKHLSNALQNDICQQCHLQGQERVNRRGRSLFEYRPGLPFDQFVRVFVRHPDLANAHRSVGQFEQMEQAKCKTKDGGQLLCTNCHDPHKVPSPQEKAAFYRNQCLKCHETTGCTTPLHERELKQNNCVTCHMPSGDSSNIAHASVTDHRIFRRPIPESATPGLRKPEAPLVPFKMAGNAVDPELDRDLGIALGRLVGNLPMGSEGHQLVGRMAQKRLTDSLQVWKTDTDAWIMLSRIHASNGEFAERLVAAERAVKLSPTSEFALIEFAESALGESHFDQAEDAARRLVEMSPRNIDHWLLQASVHAAQKQWVKAESDCRAVLRIQPLHAQAKIMRALYLFKLGQEEEAEKEADNALDLMTKAQQKKTLRDWFQREKLRPK